MNHFIEVTKLEGTKCLVNVAHIVRIAANGHITLQELDGDSNYAFQVQESYDVLKAMILNNDSRINRG